MLLLCCCSAVALQLLVRLEIAQDLTQLLHVIVKGFTHIFGRVGKCISCPLLNRQS